MVSVGDILSLTIEKPAAGGRMIARAEGLVVLVSGAIPGERVRAVVERVGKGVVYAAVTAVDESSADRREAAGDPLCGGCLYAHITYPRQLGLKSLVIADALSRIGRITLPAPVSVAASPETGYRMRARVHVRRGLVGFFREGTHQVCDARQTGQLRSDTVEVLGQLGASLASLGLTTVQEIDVAENLDASERVVHLDTTAPIDPELLDQIASTIGLTGVSSPRAARGSVHVTDTVTAAAGVNVALRRHVLAFFQGNRFLLNDIVSHVVAEVGSANEVFDLYSGVGLFAVSVAMAFGGRVTAVEGDRAAASDLRTNAAVAGGRIDPVHQSVEQFVHDASGRGVRVPSADRVPPDVIIADPPRTGLSREVLDGIVSLRASKVVYVSCDVATLARDARRLVDDGYAIQRIDAFDLFPNTPHIETVVVFRI
jgi:23S rRNA (uracil1939-C5)-methyltransferase